MGNRVVVATTMVSVARPLSPRAKAPRRLVVQCADTEARFRAGIRPTVSSSSAPTPLTSIRHAVFRTTAALRGPPINWV
ncbi:hypothetical protein HMPREF0551_1847 [Lautropia mirabilis ATCC 51599]|uniref:Uncharacterized protein n=1 Tax=Lautropia mirabilis ATCC 51599 TaxID=887898 RepID=E7RYT3_9BURK|nr:hypothetical protein HMPREF0551_1847 [Lautropia mirabilis ATCC 51599]